MRDSEVEARRIGGQGRVRARRRAFRSRCCHGCVKCSRSEKDGQVRLFLFDILTDLGPDAEPAVPALLDTLRTNYGGQEQGGVASGLPGGPRTGRYWKARGRQVYASF